MLLVVYQWIFSQWVPFWRQGFHIISKALKLTPECPKWMPLATGCNESLYFVRCPIRNNPEPTAARGLAEERGRGAWFGHPVEFRHPLIGAVKACVQVYWLNWRWIQCKNENAGSFRVALQAYSAADRGFEAKFQMSYFGFRNSERQLDTQDVLCEVFLLSWEFWIPLDCMLVRFGFELWLE